MAVAAKTSLRKALTQSDLVDPLGLSPFVALHLGEADRIHVRRSGTVGFVETVDAPGLSDTGWVFVSYAHLQDCLKILETDDVEIMTLPHGGTLIRSVGGDYQTELRVHTVDRTRSGFKHHAPGDPWRTIEPTWLGGLNVRPFSFSAPPILSGQRLILPTISGIVTWEATYDPDLPSFPRESFLKAVSGLDKVPITLTYNGFFTAQLDGVSLFIASHQGVQVLGPLMGDADEGVNLPGSRLILALDRASAHAAQGASVKISPKTGVSTKDQYANPSTWSLGDVEPFPAIQVSPRTSRLLVDALGQAEGDAVTLARLAGTSDLFRATRGCCSVSFRVPPTS